MLLDALTAAVEAAVVKLASVDQLKADLKTAQDALAAAQADAAAAQVQVDGLTAKLNA